METNINNLLKSLKNRYHRWVTQYSTVCQNKTLFECFTITIRAWFIIFYHFDSFPFIHANSRISFHAQSDITLNSLLQKCIASLKYYTLEYAQCSIIWIYGKLSSLKIRTVPQFVINISTFIVNVCIFHYYWIEKFL